MKRVFEADDWRALRVRPRDLDGILDGFGAGIEGESFFLGNLPGASEFNFSATAT